MKMANMVDNKPEKRWQIYLGSSFEHDNASFLIKALKLKFIN